MWENTKEGENWRAINRFAVMKGNTTRRKGNM
jgi:hypothetical protein